MLNPATHSPPSTMEMIFRIEPGEAPKCGSKTKINRRFHWHNFFVHISVCFGPHLAVCSGITPGGECGEHVECQESNLAGLHARQVSTNYTITLDLNVHFPLLSSSYSLFYSDKVPGIVQLPCEDTCGRN